MRAPLTVPQEAADAPPDVLHPEQLQVVVVVVTPLTVLELRLVLEPVHPRAAQIDLQSVVGAAVPALPLVEAGVHFG